MKRCGFILLCALVVLCVLLAGCEGKTAERSEAGEVFAFCGGEAENFAKTFDVKEMNCMDEEDAYQLENDAALWKALREVK